MTRCQLELRKLIGTLVLHDDSAAFSLDRLRQNHVFEPMLSFAEVHKLIRSMHDLGWPHRGSEVLQDFLGRQWHCLRLPTAARTRTVDP